MKLLRELRNLRNGRPAGAAVSPDEYRAPPPEAKALPRDSARVRGAGLVLPRALFNEQAYLARNDDVAAAVNEGLTTAYKHYVDHGHEEELAGRRPRSMPTQSAPLGVRYHADEALLERVIDLEIEKRALLANWESQLHKINHIDFGMLAEDVDDAVAPPLDREICDETRLDDDQLFWRRNGYLVKEGLIPHDMIDRYCEIRERVPSAGGWQCPVPYMYVNELRELSLYPPLMQLMKRLIGEEMGLHLNLTGWVSTERNWHQDDYLNPPYINSWYTATWIALDDIHPDCGPFEFVPGSHRWPLMKSHKVRMFLNPEERAHHNWAGIAERFVNDVAQEEIRRRGLQPKKFIARKGDVLIWHGRLMHRGSYPNVPGMPRKTLISHYSGISHRIDMPDVEYTPGGSAFFKLNLPLDFDPYVEHTAVPE
jgi:hypothetical protein